MCLLTVLAGKKLEVTRVTMDELNALIAAGEPQGCQVTDTWFVLRLTPVSLPAAPSPFAVFGEIIIKAAMSGL